MLVFTGGLFSWSFICVAPTSHNHTTPVHQIQARTESLIDSYEILIANSTAGESLPCRGILNQMRRRRDTTAPSATMPMLRRANVEGSGTDVIVIAEKVAVPLLFGWLGSFPIWK